MDTIDRRVLQDAASYVEEATQYALVHTVTLTLNGQHGGVDVIIEGTVTDEYSNVGDAYARTYELRCGW